MRIQNITIYRRFLLRYDISNHIVGSRLHQHHLLYNMGYTSLILIICGHSYHPIVFQDINWFSCFQIFICPNYFYCEQYLSASGKLLRRKTICWYRGYVRNTPWWWYNLFWFGVVTELFVHGCPNTRKESSSSKPSKLNLPSCRNSVRIPRYSLICSDDGFN